MEDINKSTIVDEIIDIGKKSGMFGIKHVVIPSVFLKQYTMTMFPGSTYGDMISILTMKSLIFAGKLVDYLNDFKLKYLTIKFGKHLRNQKVF